MHKQVKKDELHSERFILFVLTGFISIYTENTGMR